MPVISWYCLARPRAARVAYGGHADVIYLLLEINPQLLKDDGEYTVVVWNEVQAASKIP